MAVNITTERAAQKTYLTDVQGSFIVPFQFSSPELEFTEGGNFSEVNRVGEYFGDMFWNNGRSNRFEFKFFLDRTLESFTSDDYNSDPFSEVRRFPNRNPRYEIFDSIGLINAIRRKDTSSGFQSSLRSRTSQQANEVAPSTYTASPEFPQTSFNENNGVIPDLERLLKFVRPIGFNLSEGRSTTEGKVSITMSETGRFTPPPKCRFFHGNIWKEGYITEVNYKLSVMNKELIPKRLDARVSFAPTRWGYLNDLNQSTFPNA